VVDFAARLQGHEASPDRYRLITIDNDLGLELVGFMAYISTALAQAGVPIFPYAAYTRDHIVVPASHFDTAMTTLEKLRAGE